MICLTLALGGAIGAFGIMVGSSITTMCRKRDAHEGCRMNRAVSLVFALCWTSSHEYWRTPPSGLLPESYLSFRYEAMQYKFAWVFVSCSMAAVRVVHVSAFYQNHRSLSTGYTHQFTGRDGSVTLAHGMGLDR